MTISVDDDWNIENLRRAALRFPALVAKTPVRTYAILTKYTLLKGYYAKKAKLGPAGPLSYENAAVYTTIPQDTFIDYKTIAKDFQFLEVDVEFVKEPFPPTLTGLKSAKSYIRRMMNTIVKDVREPKYTEDFAN